MSGNVSTSYITTSIPYVNAAPHLGFALELCIADALARHRRRRGRTVYFATGTDDHSLKNVLAAERAGVPTAQWVTGHADRFQSLNRALGISADVFLRTSANPHHAPAVEALWKACAARGDLYRRAYRGLYCQGCERFYEPQELAEGRCPEHEAPLEIVEEENWFFRLSRYGEVVRAAIESGRLRIPNPGAREETLAFLRGPVGDLSVSRSAARARGWGLRVPGDPSQVIWVWFDALSHYLAALGYGGRDPLRFQTFWSSGGEQVHVVGKGIGRFHAVFWPAFLQSAGLPWPTDLLVHGYLTLDGAKISKSSATLDPLPLIERYGSDAVRYSLLRHVRTDRDGDFCLERFVQAHDSELANGLGNLLGRLAALVEKLSQGAIPEAKGGAAPEEELSSQVASLPAAVDEAVGRFALDEALSAIFRLLDRANGYLTRAAPWDLARSGQRARAVAVLRAALEALWSIAGELSPFLPAASAEIRARLGAPPEERPQGGPLPTDASIRRGPSLFQRIDRSETNSAKKIGDQSSA